MLAIVFSLNQAQDCFLCTWSSELDSRRKLRIMKHLLLTTIAAVLVVGCGESQQSTPSPEAKPVEPVAEAAKPESLTAKAPDISIWDAARVGSIEAVKQFIADGADVNAKASDASTPLHLAALKGQKEIAELLIAEGANVNAKGTGGRTPLNTAIIFGRKEIEDLLRKHGGKTKKELKAAGK